MNGEPIKIIDIGARVKIIEPKLREGSYCDCGCGCYFNDDMCELIGKICTIKEQDSNYNASRGKFWFRLKEEQWVWCKSWLKVV